MAYDYGRRDVRLLIAITATFQQINMSLYRLLLVSLLISSFISCRKQDGPEKAPYPSHVLMEAEGGSETIFLGSDGWQVAGVVNKNGDQRIFGDIYTPDGQILKENSLLELDGPGRLEGALGLDREFTIVYEQDRIYVTLAENSADDVFNFAILLKKGDETKEIVVEQNISQGYTFREISYSLGEGDGDSVYIKTSTRYQFNLVTPQEVSVNPFGGVDIVRTAYFESDVRGAFSWLSKDSVTVPVPVDIHGPEVTTGTTDEDIYGAITRAPFNSSDVVAVIDVPAGGARFFTELEWRRRRVSYKLTMENNRTGELKEVAGKWIEISPTGNYQIHRE